MTKRTREKWADRIREWRASGKSAEEFTEGKDYRASSLRAAVRRLNETASHPMSTPAAAKATGRRRGAERLVPTPPPPRAPRFMPVRMRRAEPAAPEMIVEVGGARIRVARGVDVAFLGDVVRALQGGGR
jgi:hypothetical protein